MANGFANETQGSARPGSETGRDGMRQRGRGGRCRPRSLGAWPRDAHVPTYLSAFVLDEPERA